MDAESIKWLAPPAVGLIIWLVRLEGRINTHDALFRSLKEDVEYIRERIDHALSRD